MRPFKLPPKHPTTLTTCSSMELEAFELSPQPQHSKSTLVMCAMPSASSIVALISLVNRLPSVSSPFRFLAERPQNVWSSASRQMAHVNWRATKDADPE